MKYTPQVLAYYFMRSVPRLGLWGAAKLVAAGVVGRELEIPAPGVEKEIFEHPTDWVKAVDHLCIEIHGCWATVMKALAPYEFQAEMVGEYLCLEFKNGGRREL